MHNGLKIHVARSRHIICVEQPGTLLLSSMCLGVSREKYGEESIWIFLGKMEGMRSAGHLLFAENVSAEIGSSCHVS